MFYWRTAAEAASASAVYIERMRLNKFATRTHTHTLHTAYMRQLTCRTALLRNSHARIPALLQCGCARAKDNAHSPPSPKPTRTGVSACVDQKPIICLGFSLILCQSGAYADACSPCSPHQTADGRHIRPRARRDPLASRAQEAGSAVRGSRILRHMEYVGEQTGSTMRHVYSRAYKLKSIQRRERERQRKRCAGVCAEDSF